MKPLDFLIDQVVDGVLEKLSERLPEVMPKSAPFYAKHPVTPNDLIKTFDTLTPKKLNSLNLKWCTWDGCQNGKFIYYAAFEKALDERHVLAGNDLDALSVASAQIVLPNESEVSSKARALLGAN